MFIPKVDYNEIITDSSPKWYIDGTYRNIINQYQYIPTIMRDQLHVLISSKRLGPDLVGHSQPRLWFIHGQVESRQISQEMLDRKYKNIQKISNNAKILVLVVFVCIDCFRMHFNKTYRKQVPGRTYLTRTTSLFCWKWPVKHYTLML